MKMFHSVLGIRLLKLNLIIKKYYNADIKLWKSEPDPHHDDIDFNIKRKNTSRDFLYELSQFLGIMEIYVMDFL